MTEDGHHEEHASAEDLLDQIGCFDPAESLFDAATSPPEDVTTVEPVADLNSVMDLLAELQATGAGDVGDALQQVREALAPIAKVVGTPPPAAVSPLPAAEDVELECEFDSVTDVLEGVFGQAALVAEAAVEASVYAPSAATSAAPAPVAVAETPNAPPPVDDDVEIDRILSSIAGDLPPDVAAEPVDDPPPALIALPPDGDEPKDEPAEPDKLANLIAQIASLTLVALTWINFPLRFVPPKLRVAVDWLALTLVFWVPVVWLIAWLA